MKSSLIRPALALTLALGLSACGGGSGKAEFTVAGSVHGQIYPGLLLTTNGMEIAVNPAPNATDKTVVPYAFPNKLEYGDEYHVIIKQEPAHQNCDFASTFRDPINKDTAGRLAAINVTVLCSVEQHTISGKVTGLTVDGLVLANGSTGGTVTLNKGATEYGMPALVPYGQTYGITVITQPAGLSCTVANAVGTMGDANVSNADVTCVPRT